MNDDLERFHTRNMTQDPQYAVARQLLDLGEAVTQLRQGAKLTRAQLAKRLGVKSRDIEMVEEQTPRASAGLLEAALRLLVQNTPAQKVRHKSDIAASLRTVRHLRPGLIAA